MKKNFFDPEIRVERFPVEDVITASSVETIDDNETNQIVAE
jgi:hypothetical protein